MSFQLSYTPGSLPASSSIPQLSPRQLGAAGGTGEDVALVVGPHVPSEPLMHVGWEEYGDAQMMTARSDLIFFYDLKCLPPHFSAL